MGAAPSPSSPADAVVRAKLFVSYSHRDSIWLEKLKPHLGSLARERGFDTEFFDDTHIRVGSEWRARIDEAMHSAQVAILLISKYFLDSEFITSNELPPLLQAAEQAKTVILPVVLSPCRYNSHAALSKIQSVNPPSEPLEGMSKVRCEAVLVKVTDLVDEALRKAATAACPFLAVPSTAKDAALPANKPVANTRKSAKAGKIIAGHGHPAPHDEPALTGVPRVMSPLLAIDNWSRVVVQSQPDGSIQFQTIENNGRMDALLLPPQRKLLDNLAQRCSAGSGPFDAKLACAVFELLVPNELKPVLFRGEGTVLTLDATTAQYPWEMLQDGLDEQALPFSLRAPMVRNTVSHRFTPHPTIQLHQALVVGDILLDAQFSPLAGAREEAEVITRLLEKSAFAVRKQVEESGLEFMTALFSQPYQVLHLAGHGAYEEVIAAGDEPVTGFVLDKGMCFSGAEVRQLRVAPELVFLNASNLGRHKVPDAPQDGASIRYAPSLPDQFMAIGSRAIVAPVGPPEDAAALTFATAFYGAMLAGSALGQAMLAARRETHKRHEHTNTWGLYVCYGDPDYRLVTTGPAAR